MPRKVDALLDEKRIFKPSKDISDGSNIQKWMENHGLSSYSELIEAAARSPEWFWDELAGELEWFSPYNTVLKWDPPHAEWFLDGKFNVVHNALDRHAKGPNKDKIAYIWEGESGEVRTLTYLELYREVNTFANALKRLGVKKGDVVSIYLPMIPELPIAMLACAKIGAAHSVVFSGFWAKAFRDRINDAGSNVAITADGFKRRGKLIELKEAVDTILFQTPTIESVVVVEHEGLEVSMEEGRDIWWHESVQGMDYECETEVMDSEDPLFILYTSGTTGKPKGVLHVHGGYSVGIYATLKFVFDLKDEDIWWCAADIGWITGHSYIVYAPLIMGVTSLLYEGTPDYPDPGRFWRMVQDHDVTVLYTAPTTVRMFMKYGEKWQFSNRIGLSATWDGRDLIDNTTKGYLISQNFVYAGGILGGLSNYIRSSTSASGFLKVFEIPGEKPTPGVVSLSTTVSFMLPQYYASDGAWNWDLSASKYEYLYIDGMTVARGIEPTFYYEFLWDSSLDFSVQIVQNVLWAEAFASATGASGELSSVGTAPLDWFFAMGAGIKLKIPGFPLGLYMVKNARIEDGNPFAWDSGSIFSNPDNDQSGLKLVLAITTSLY